VGTDAQPGLTHICQCDSCRRRLLFCVTLGIDENNYHLIGGLERMV